MQSSLLRTQSKRVEAEISVSKGNGWPMIVAGTFSEVLHPCIREQCGYQGLLA